MNLQIQTPTSASGILPEPLANLILSPDSPIAQYYPTKVQNILEGFISQFDLDFNLHRYRWLAIPKIPVLDYETIHNAYLKTLPQVSETDRQINKVGDDYIYVGDCLDAFIPLDS